MRVSRGIAAFLVVLGFGGAAALATVIDPSLDCLSEDNERRISGCSAMIETPGLPPEQLSVAYGLRALGYSLKGWFDKAVADYDKAIGLNPDFAAALNNRAWAYYKLGRPQQGAGDVERALELAPGNPYALDTRAHIHQSSGRRSSRAVGLRARHALRRRDHREALSVRAALAEPLLRRARWRLFERRQTGAARLH